MAFQYQYSNQSVPYLQSNPQMAQFVQQLLASISGNPQGNAPQYGDTQGAFDAANAAARAQQEQITANQQAANAEQAAASGKTWSSAALNKAAETAQQGGINLAAILGQLGLQQQSVLGHQAEQTANAANLQQELAARLASSVGGIQTKDSTGQGIPGYDEQYKNYLADQAREFAQMMQLKQWEAEQMKKLQPAPAPPAPAPFDLQKAIWDKLNPQVPNFSTMGPAPQPNFIAQLGATLGGGISSYDQWIQNQQMQQLERDRLTSMLGGGTPWTDIFNQSTASTGGVYQAAAG
jgi:hypothetical protein